MEVSTTRRPQHRSYTGTPKRDSEFLETRWACEKAVLHLGSVLLHNWKDDTLFFARYYNEEDILFSILGAKITAFEIP